MSRSYAVQGSCGITVQGYKEPTCCLTYSYLIRTKMWVKKHILKDERSVEGVSTTHSVTR
jgi:hypothetical protein